MFLSVLFTIIGLVFAALGLVVWKKEKIDLFHFYHVDNVKDEDKIEFCILSGIGLIVIGVGFVFSGLIVLGYRESFIWVIPMVIGLALGISILASTINKLNK